MIVFLRHGESMGNAWKLAYKNEDFNFLSPKGVLQAELAGETLKGLGIKFDSVYSSALTRARHTTCVVLHKLNDWQREIIIEPNLNEWNYNSKTETEHRECIGLAVNRILSDQAENILVVSHYHSMQHIFDHLGIERTIVPWHKGAQIPNATPYFYDGSRLTAHDPKDHGPQY